MALNPEFDKMTPKERAEVMKGASDAMLSFNHLLAIIPFDPIPGGDLKYTHKKKDDD